MKKHVVLLGVILGTIIIITSIIIYLYINSQTYSNIKNLKVDVTKKFKPLFVPEGIEDIALIMMVKDEADIILENLVWHFSIGFRKFIIIDNDSSDGTRELISEFATLTKDKAQVFIIEDPVQEYIQSRIITGSYKYVNYLWPDVKWVFPVDADEFWIAEYKLSEILAKIPENCDVITILRTRHFATKEYYNYEEDIPFYDKIPLREKNLTTWSNKTWNCKIAVRSGKKNLFIIQGNHSAKKEYIDLSSIKFASGNIYGLHMTEYTMRSIKQTKRKLSNGLKAVSLAMEKEYKEAKRAGHWLRYQEDLKKFGDYAAKLRFEETFILPENAVNDPLPIKEAFSIFKQIVNPK